MDVVAGEFVPSVYGPIKSRRHGRSLGINVGLIDHKVCTWSCLYCQCGFGEKRDFAADESRLPLNNLLDKIKTELRKHVDLDSLTFAGNTEPGTYPEILPLVKELLKFRLMTRAKWKLIFLSNGSELEREDVIQAFNLADEAWIKIDTGTEDSFKTLSRPLARVGLLADHLNRIKKLKKIRIQTLLWKNLSKPDLGNDHEENLKALLQVYEELQPTQIHLTTVARDPAMKGIVPVNESQMQAFHDRIHALNLNCSVVL